MSTDHQEQFLNSILDEIKRHKDLYKLVELQCVIARRKDIVSREGKWHNFATLIKMLHSGILRPLKKQVEKNDFAILSAVITIDDFAKVLAHLVKDHILEVDGYQAYGPFDFGQKEFLDSKRSKMLYDIDWAVNLWRVTGKENLGLPDSRSLELELEDVPFEDPIDAIRYHTGISLRTDTSLQNAIHIVAPLYYARIKNVKLSNEELIVEIERNVANPQDLRIKYNTEGPDERSQYYRTLEAGTVQSDEQAVPIHLKEYAEAATVWLYHTSGHKIDSRTTRRLSIEKIEKQLSQDNPHLWEEETSIITETIDLHFKTDMPALMTTEQVVDSIDVDILKAIKNLGGDYAKFIPEVLKYLSLNSLLSRLARLRTLAFLTMQPPRKILLTPLGVDALNLPPSVLSAKVPPEVGMRIAEIKSAFREEDYDEVTNKSTKLLEALLREGLKAKFGETFQDVWPNLNLGPYERASLGTLREACLRLKVFKENSIADHLISSILRLRIPMSHEKEEIGSPSYIAMLTVEVIEAFIRNWYYLEL